MIGHRRTQSVRPHLDGESMLISYFSLLSANWVYSVCLSDNDNNRTYELLIFSGKRKVVVSELEQCSQQYSMDVVKP